MFHSSGNSQCFDLTRKPERLMVSYLCTETTSKVKGVLASHIQSSTNTRLAKVTIHTWSSGFGSVIEQEDESAFLAVVKAVCSSSVHEISSVDGSQEEQGEMNTRGSPVPKPYMPQ